MQHAIVPDDPQEVSTAQLSSKQFAFQKLLAGGMSFSHLIYTASQAINASHTGLHHEISRQCHGTMTPRKGGGAPYTLKVVTSIEVHCCVGRASDVRVHFLTHNYAYCMIFLVIAIQHRRCRLVEASGLLEDPQGGFLPAPLPRTRSPG